MSLVYLFLCFGGSSSALRQALQQVSFIPSVGSRSARRCLSERGARRGRTQVDGPMRSPSTLLDPRKEEREDGGLQMDDTSGSIRIHPNLQLFWGVLVDECAVSHES